MFHDLPKTLERFCKALLPVCGARWDASRGGSMQDAGAESIACGSMYCHYSLRWNADTPGVNGRNTCNAISFHTIMAGHSQAGSMYSQ